MKFKRSLNEINVRANLFLLFSRPFRDLVQIPSRTVMYDSKTSIKEPHKYYFYLTSVPPEQIEGVINQADLSNYMVCFYDDMLMNSVIASKIPVADWKEFYTDIKHEGLKEFLFSLWKENTEDRNILVN